MVLYFSGTGNSRYAAKRIAEISGDDLISIGQKIKSGDYSAIRSEKPFGFVGPVYAGRFPRVMNGLSPMFALPGTSAQAASQGRGHKRRERLTIKSQAPK